MEGANGTGRDCWGGCINNRELPQPGQGTARILPFLGCIKEDRDKFSSSVPGMASVSVALECKMSKVSHHCMKHHFIGFGAQSSLVLELQEISFDLAPKSLWEFPQLSHQPTFSFPI